MVVRFEERLEKESSVPWACQEANTANEVGSVVVTVPAGTPGQQFQVKLMQDLFMALGRDEYVINPESKDSE
jgi:hypothetical protein